MADPRLRVLPRDKGARERPIYEGPKVRMTHRWRELDSNLWYRGAKAVDFRSIGTWRGIDEALKRFRLIGHSGVAKGFGP